jgi:hypothetical protein
MVVAGLPHQVTQRGNRREPIFFENGDQDIYRDLLAEQTRKAGVEGDTSINGNLCTLRAAENGSCGPAWPPAWQWSPAMASVVTQNGTLREVRVGPFGYETEGQMIYQLLRAPLPGRSLVPNKLSKRDLAGGIETQGAIPLHHPPELRAKLRQQG